MNVYSLAVTRDPALYEHMRSAEAEILGTLAVDGRPLTLMQLHVRTGIPLEEVDQITGRLCTARSITRLNTIVETFCLRTKD